MSANKHIRLQGRLITAALASIVLAVLTEEVLAGGPATVLDVDVDRWLLNRGRSGLVADLAERVTRIATPQWSVAASLVLAAAMSGYARSWQPLGRMVVATLVLTVSVVGIKTAIGRPGPHRPDATGYYPSGHTTTAIVCGGTLLFLSHQLWPRLRQGHAIGVTALWGLLVGWAMTWRGYHWLSDVVAAWCLGTLILLALRTPAGERLGGPGSTVRLRRLQVDVLQQTDGEERSEHRRSAV